MNVSFLVAIAQTSIGNNGGEIELAVIAASAVPVIGGAVTGTSFREIRQISNKFLRYNLWLAFGFRVVAAIAFIVAVAFGIAGATSISNTIYTALGSAALASIGQLIDISARRSENFALSVEQMKHEVHDRDQNRSLLLHNLEAIENPELRDQTRAQVSQALVSSLTTPMPAPALDMSQEKPSALEPGHVTVTNPIPGDPLPPDRDPWL
jgi:hypothetical protein